MQFGRSVDGNVDTEIIKTKVLKNLNDPIVHFLKFMLFKKAQKFDENYKLCICEGLNSYSSGPNNSVVLNKRVGDILFTLYRWKCMILGKSQILLDEKIHVGGMFLCE